MANQVHFEIDHNADNLNQALGITDERREELLPLYKELILKETEKENDAVSILNMMEDIQRLAQTPGELVFLVFNLDPAVQQIVNPMYRTLMAIQDNEESTD